jgi:DNA-binding LacI/PurR family transcriptional regulator
MGLRAGSPAATAADVARLAGVSPMTVSRVLRGRGPVSDETRAAVLRAAAMLDYRPNEAAKELAAARGTR